MLSETPPDAPVPHLETQRELSLRPRMTGAAGDVFPVAPTDVDTLRAFFEESTLMHAVVELEADDFRYAVVNAASAARVGLRPSQMVGRTATQLGIPRRIIDAWLPVIRGALATGKPQRTDFSSHGRAMSSIIIPLVEGAAGRPRFGFITEDVTEQRRMREQLELSERRALVGCVAAGAAHEIKNPLCFAAANVDFARRVLQSSDETARAEALEALGDAAEGLARIGRIAQDMLALSRKEPGEVSVVDLGSLVGRSVSLAKLDIRKVAKIDLQLCDAPPAAVDAVRLEQVVLNLLLNAVDAMRAVPSRDHVLKIKVTPADGGSAIEVVDTGCGIPKENLPLIFDAFFTTKGKAGTGLGLSIAAEAMRSFGGALTAHSDGCSGTRFRLWLPAAADYDTASLRES